MRGRAKVGWQNLAHFAAFSKEMNDEGLRKFPNYIPRSISPQSYHFNILYQICHSQFTFGSLFPAEHIEGKNVTVTN